MYEILKRILSDKTKHKIFQLFVKIIRRKLIDVEKRIPKYVLTQKHINNLKALENRNALLHVLPKNGVIAELGVNKGDFSDEILKITQPEKLHLVDMWNTKRYHNGLKNEVEIKFDKEISENKVEINIGLSTDVVNQFPDNYFDWIYIDTEHSYKCTIAELELYAPKIKNGGMITGHDYVIGSWINLVRYGVIEAVAEFCTKNNWELIYLTTDYTEPPSFAIRKMN